MSFGWERPEDFLRKRGRVSEGVYQPLAPESRPEWQSPEEFMRPLAPNSQLTMDDIRPRDTGPLAGPLNFLKGAGQAVQDAFQWASDKPVIGGALQGLGTFATPINVAFGLPAYAASDSARRVAAENYRTLEGGEPGILDLPAFGRAMRAASETRADELRLIAENESVSLPERGLAGTGQLLYGALPNFAPLLPAAARLARRPAAQVPAAPLALPAGDAIPMRSPVEPVGSTVRPGYEIARYRPVTFDALRPKAEPVIEGEFHELPPAPTRRVALQDLQAAVERASADLRSRELERSIEQPAQPRRISIDDLRRSRTTTDDTLIGDLAESIRARGGVVPEGFGQGVRERAVHDANEAAIAAVQRAAKSTGREAEEAWHDAHAALDRVQALGGDLSHTAARIRAATGLGPTAGELPQLAQGSSRVPGERRGLRPAVGEFIRGESGEATVERALNADILRAAQRVIDQANRVANARRPLSMAERIEAGQPRRAIVSSRDRFMERLRDVETPFRATEARPGEWEVRGPTGARGEFPPLKPESLVRLNELEVGDRFVHEGFEFEVVSRELAPADFPDLPYGGGIEVRSVSLPDRAGTWRGDMQVIRVTNTDLPMLRELPPGTIVEARSASGQGTVRLEYLGQGARDVAYVRYDGMPEGQQSVTWGHGEARVRPIRPASESWQPENFYDTRAAAEKYIRDVRAEYPGTVLRVTDHGVGPDRYVVESKGPAPQSLVLRTKDAAEATSRAADLNAQQNARALRFSGVSRFIRGESGSATVEQALGPLARPVAQMFTRADAARVRAERRAKRVGMADLRPRGEGPKRGIGREVYESIRTLKSLIDLPLGRQGIRVIGNPVAFAKGAKESLVAYKRGPAHAKQWLEQRQKDPLWKRFVEVGELELTDPTAGSVVGKLGREEFFPGGAIENVPLLGTGIKHSNAAYSHSLNVMRWEKMKGDLQMAELIWKNLYRRRGPLPDSEVKAIGRLVNVSTGRGYIGKLGPLASEALGTAFFSPRNTVSWPEFFVDWARAAKEGNVAAAAVSAKTLAAWLGFAVAVLKVREAMGQEVEWDMRSADFMKVRDGDDRIDVMGGGQQWIVALARMASGEIKSSDGKVRPMDSDDVIGSFIMNRAHPAISTAEKSTRLTMTTLRRAVEGKQFTGTAKDAYGDEYGALEVILGATAPIIVESFIENVRFEMEADNAALEDAIASAARLTAIEFPGFGTNRYRSGVKMPAMFGTRTEEPNRVRATAPRPTPTPRSAVPTPALLNR